MQFTQAFISCGAARAKSELALHVLAEYVATVADEGPSGEHYRLSQAQRRVQVGENGL